MGSPSLLSLRCEGCGASVPVDCGPWLWSCPRQIDGDDIDHLLVPVVDDTWIPSIDPASDNPFVRYRTRLSCYQVWRLAGHDDASFIQLVDALDRRVADVAGTGFRTTPLRRFDALDEAVGARVWVKDETGNVAGSHKGRHLFGIAILLEVLDQLGRGSAGDLAIASCGNAALAAAVVASAVGRRLSAFVPADADPATLGRLGDLGVAVELCPRDGRPGDPCYRCFRRAVAAGAVPFSCQGPDNGSCLEGASLLAWEIVEALPEQPDRVVIQVGGGALASAVVRGLRRPLQRASRQALPTLDTVQTASAHPLEKALRRLREDTGVATDAARRRSRYMGPWESPPASVARGILDDETYDWLLPARAMLETGGTAVVADEATLIEANRLARRTTGIDVDETGTAGLAGLLVLARTGRVRSDEDVVVLFTGAAGARGTGG
ncbi:MAG: pyridoxal-phosphate dependent enzyme [Acidimicrobiales bacterium]